MDELEKRVDALEKKVSELDSRTMGLMKFAGGKMSNGPWTYDILRSLVSRVKCKPGWTFRIIEEDGALRMVIRIHCRDAYDQDTAPDTLDHYFPVPPATYNEKSWRRWMFEQCRRLENHELGEFFVIDGERPFAPMHGPGEDPYTVHEIRDEVDALTTQDGSVREKS